MVQRRCDLGFGCISCVLFNSMNQDQSLDNVNRMDAHIYVCWYAFPLNKEIKRMHQYVILERLPSMYYCLREGRRERELVTRVINEFFCE